MWRQPMKRRLLAAWPAAWRGPWRICPWRGSQFLRAASASAGDAQGPAQIVRLAPIGTWSTWSWPAADFARAIRLRRPTPPRSVRSHSVRSPGWRRVGAGARLSQPRPCPKNPPYPAVRRARPRGGKRREQRAAPRSGVIPRLRPAAIARNYPTRPCPSVVHAPAPAHREAGRRDPPRSRSRVGGSCGGRVRAT